jgi:hypothetical protein
MFRHPWNWPRAMTAVWLATSGCGSSLAIPPAPTVTFERAEYRPVVAESLTLTPRVVGGGKDPLIRWWVETPSPRAGEYPSPNGASGLSLVLSGSAAIVTPLDVGTFDVWADVESSTASVHIAAVRPPGSIPLNGRCAVNSECQSAAPRCAPNFCDGFVNDWGFCSTTCASDTRLPV